MLTGREATGVPKVFADIEEHHQLGDYCFTNASYEGSRFLRLEIHRTQEMAAEEVAMRHQQPQLNWFGWRYIPNIGTSGATLSHATLFPQETIVKSGWHGEGAVQWDALTREQHPLQAHIISALSRLPIGAHVRSEIVEKVAIGRSDLARSLP